MRLALAREPFFAVALVASADSRSNALAIGAWRIANGVANIRRGRILFVARETPTRVWGRADAMHAGLFADGNAMVAE